MSYVYPTHELQKCVAFLEIAIFRWTSSSYFKLTMANVKKNFDHTIFRWLNHHAIFHYFYIF